MTATKEQILPLPELSVEVYRVEQHEKVLTPALVIYPAMVDANIEATLRLVAGNSDRLRPHIKTAKLSSVMRRMVDRGITHFKCSTTLELSTVCSVGAKDVLFAYPAVGANATRVRQLAASVEARVSALVENSSQVQEWKGSNVTLFVDVNPGMDRTGVEQERTDDIVRLVHTILGAGLSFRGLHYYDGHISKFDLNQREESAHRGYDRLLEIVEAVQGSGVGVEEVITAGTPAFPYTLSYQGFHNGSFTHRASPGTLIYCDSTSLAQLPPECGYSPAALVLSTVVSHPVQRHLTCDAGHKTVSADAGVPTCAVLGRPDLLPLKPSEEHLPIQLLSESRRPAIGDSLYLVPRHVCPTVNNFDYALLVEEGVITVIEEVAARGRERPLPL